MKTAVSISDDLHARADRFARHAKQSRSRVYSEALREYLARHAPDEATEAMNRSGSNDWDGKPTPRARS